MSRLHLKSNNFWMHGQIQSGATQEYNRFNPEIKNKYVWEQNVDWRQNQKRAWVIHSEALEATEIRSYANTINFCFGFKNNWNRATSICHHVLYRWHKNTTEQWETDILWPAMHKIFTMKLFMEKFNQPAI